MGLRRGTATRCARWPTEAGLGAPPLEWADFLSKTPNATREQILGFRDQIDYKYGFAFWESQQRALR